MDPKVVEKLLTDYYFKPEEFKLISVKKLDGALGLAASGQRPFTPHKITIQLLNSNTNESKNQHFVFSTLEKETNRNHANFILHLMVHLQRSGLPVPNIIPLKNSVSDENSKDVNPDDYMFVYKEYFSILRSFIGSENDSESYILDRDARCHPSNPHYSDVYEHYQTLGSLAAEVQNKILQFEPKYHHRFKTREEIALGYINKDSSFCVQNVINKLKTEHLNSKDRDLNECETYFLNNLESIESGKSIYHVYDLNVKFASKLTNV
eukprot:TRINITY_DN972_c0_g1_i5.p1 TRINITY_DN972_c0_g1~~TRINITY_DN972_c0_g1_i5.p1  ORF type:complete len:298 (+),score=19.73 TRINITY_DN972_c0_g1_i5:102-896(+)